MCCRLRPVVRIFAPEEQNDRDDRDVDDDRKKFENSCHVALWFHSSEEGEDGQTTESGWAADMICDAVPAFPSVMPPSWGLFLFPAGDHNGDDHDVDDDCQKDETHSHTALCLHD